MPNPIGRTISDEAPKRSSVHTVGGLGLCASSGLRIPPDLYRIGIEQTTLSLLDLPGITRTTHNASG